VESPAVTPPGDRWRVFLSSTSTDLLAYRAAAAGEISGLEPFGLVQMEDWGARAAARPAEQCEDKLRSCELYVAIIGHRYGSLVPPGDLPDGLTDLGPLSYTALEYELAVTIGLPAGYAKTCGSGPIGTVSTGVWSIGSASTARSGSRSLKARSRSCAGRRVSARARSLNP